MHARQDGRQGEEGNRGRPGSQNGRRRRLDRLYARDPERDEGGPDDHERGRADVDWPEASLGRAKLTSDETDEDRRGEPGVVKVDRREQRNVLAEVHDRQAGTPEDEPTATDGEVHETDRGAELLDLATRTEHARQAVERGEKR